MPGRFLKRLVRPELDVRRSDRVFRRYDRDCGYERYHVQCRAAFRQELSDEATPLVEQGVDHLHSMTATAAASTLRQIRERFEARSFRKNADRVHSYRIDDERFAEQLLAAALSPEADARIKRFFGSEYLVHWYVVNRANPGPDQNRNSFLWHCDKGPRAHLKLLVYLNGEEEHGGRTEFLDLKATQALARSGYLFGRVADRRADLAPLAERVGADYRPRSWRMAPGEALLFQPSSVLHRGVMPIRAARYMLSICLLPSPVPWDEALRRGLISDLDRDPKWHGDAMEILRGLGRAYA